MTNENWEDEQYERLNGLTMLRNDKPATFKVVMSLWEEDDSSTWWDDLMHPYEIPQYGIEVWETDLLANYRGRDADRIECKMYALWAGSEQGWAHPTDGTYISVGVIREAFIEMLKEKELLTKAGKLKTPAPKTFTFGAHNCHGFRENPLA